VNVGIECRDWKRPQSVSWVEDVRGKHSDLPVNLTVLVSSSGFAKTALNKAKHYDLQAQSVRLLTPSPVRAG
jgi:hypothetical protein